ncbi:MAG: LytTR family DNA-binding domain-containing protein [Spirosomataceae bacterium]
MNKITGIFSQPYPFDSKQLAPVRKLTRSFAEGSFIAVFLIIFEPFGINNWSDSNKIYYLLGFGLITTLSLLFLRFIITPSVPAYFNESEWTVGREIISVLILLLIIATGNVLFLFFLFKEAFSLQNFLWNLISVASIGIFPIFFGVISNYIYQLKKYKKPVAVKTHEENIPKTLTFVAENEKDTFEVAQRDLLFIESADNYAVINYIESDQLKKELLRSSLTRLEKQIESESIVRCHRSFIVNLNKVEDVTGNAQGYKFHLQTPEVTVPVARKYSDLVKRIS